MDTQNKHKRERQVIDMGIGGDVAVTSEYHGSKLKMQFHNPNTDEAMCTYLKQIIVDKLLHHTENLLSNSVTKHGERSNEVA